MANENIINGLSVSMTLADATELAITVKALEERVKAAEDAFGRERADFAAYRNAEIERNVNVQKYNEETLQQRTSILEKNERKQTAYCEYLNAKGVYVESIYAIVKERLTKTERKRMEAEKRKVDEAWEKFDKVQRECAE